MTAAASPVGLKRICTSCGVRFYDLNKRPIVCPSCNTEFTGDIKVKSRRGRLASESKKESQIQEADVNETEDDIFEEDDGLDVVSLDDAEVESDDEDEDDGVMDLDDDSLGDLPEFDEDLEEDLEEDVLLDDED